MRCVRTRATGSIAAAVTAAVILFLKPPLLGAQEPDSTEIRSGSAVVTGIVLDEDVAIPSTQVTLHLASDSTLVGVAVTDVRGRFHMEDAPDGTFFLRLQSLGYGTVSTHPFELAAAEIRDLGDLRMPLDAMELDPITVAAERSVVAYMADRDVYNVGVMSDTEGASVTQTLSRIPDLQVDMSGRVTLRGEAVAIYIDDRKAPLSGDALTGR